MKKSDWKKRYWDAEERTEQAEMQARHASSEAHALRRQIDELTRELEDKRKNWAPIKIKHPYVARDAGCMYCDDPASDPRHAPEARA